jgi:hypothetical protein
MITYARPSILCALLGVILWGATITPSQADTGTLRIVFGKAGTVAAIGGGKGILTLHGEQYAFIVAGLSIGVLPLVSPQAYSAAPLVSSTPPVISPGPILASAVAPPW